MVVRKGLNSDLGRSSPRPLASWVSCVLFDRSSSVNREQCVSVGGGRGLVASSRARCSACMTSSTLPGVMMASQVGHGEIDIHTVPCTTVTTTVASAPCAALTKTLRGIPIRGSRGRCSGGVGAFSLNAHTVPENRAVAELVGSHDASRISVELLLTAASTNWPGCCKKKPRALYTAHVVRFRHGHHQC